MISADKLLAIVNDCKKTRKEIARLAGIGESYLSQLVTGKKNMIAKDKLLRLAIALEVQVNDLLLDSAQQATAELNENAIIIGIAGPSCAGKTWLAAQVLSSRPNEIVSIDMDSYYIDSLSVEALQYKYDNPKSINSELLLLDVAKLASGREIEVPQYDFKTYREIGKKRLTPKPIIVVEGIFAFAFKGLRDEMNLKVWVDASETTRALRRIRRDHYDNKRDVDSIINHYSRDVLPAYEQHLAPSRRFADVIIGNEDDGPDKTPIAVKMILAYIDRLRSAIPI